MTRPLSESELCARVAALTPDRLSHYRHLHIVVPTETTEGMRYREIDVRRITLLCELSDDMELNEDALVIVMRLLDQLHGSRSRLDAVMRALGGEEAHVKARIIGRLTG